MNDEPKRWPALWIAFALAGVAGLLVHGLIYDFVADDTFISLRYARNLLAGQGLVYNPGERVEGFTSLLQVLVVAGLGAVGLDLLTAARLLGIVAGLAAMVLAVRITVDHVGSRRRFLPLATAALFAASPAMACWLTAGLDAPVFALALLYLVFTAGRACRGEGSMLAVGLAALVAAGTRPEGTSLGALVLAMTTAFVWRRRGGRAVVSAWAVFGLGVATLLAFRFAYYGELVPNTYYAKVGSPSRALFGRGLVYIGEWAEESGGILMLVAPFAAMIWRRDATFWLTAAAALAMLGHIAVVGGDGLPMFRFMVPFVPLWAVLVVSLIGDLMTFIGVGRWGWPWIIIVVGLCVWIAVPSRKSKHYARYVQQREWEIKAWTAVGKWLAANARPGESVACVPIGAVGYYSELPLIDMLGLTDRHIARVPATMGTGWAGHERHDGPYVLSRKPTYLLLGNIRVLRQRIPLTAPDFVRLDHPAVAAREGDIFTPELERWYEPRVAEVGEGLYLHYLKRRDE